jgi:SAM-dependent methyltransferase
MRRASKRALSGWLRAKLRNLAPTLDARQAASIARQASGRAYEADTPQFENPFSPDDLLIFDDASLRDLLGTGAFSLDPDEIAHGLCGASPEVIKRVRSALPECDRLAFERALGCRLTPQEEVDARCRLMDAFFWDLTYWKTPDLYDELTEGEPIHPGIFRRLAPLLRGARVLDAGAGATFACLDAGASHVSAMDASPALLRLLDRKAATRSDGSRVTSVRGRFDAIPLPDATVDVALACSAFTSNPAQGGEPGLAELLRVTRPGGFLVLIWPLPEDYHWLADHGFRYVALPVRSEPQVHFRSRAEALRVARRFYGRNAALRRYLLRHCTAEVPYSLVGTNPPHDYCWLCVGSSSGRNPAQRSGCSPA